jgi:Flp pilus assembly pilin Flp
MTGIEKGVNAVLAGLIVVAIASVLVSNKSSTSSVLNSAGGALSGSLTAAEAG